MKDLNNAFELTDVNKKKLCFEDISFSEEEFDFKPTNVNKKDFDDTGIQICEHCRGTGINPKYEKVNKIINAILDYNHTKRREDYKPKSDVPYCIYCLGEGTIHRNQNHNKIDKKEIVAKMQYRKNISKSYSDIEIFLIYVANCETIYDCDKETAMRYDIIDDSWKEYNGSFNMEEARLKLVNWMRDFRTHGYFDVMVKSAEYHFYKKNVSKRWIGLQTRRTLDICWCCNRHYTELKRFRSPGDPDDGHFTGPYLLKTYRSFGPYNEEAEKALEEAYKCNRNDRDAEHWLINKYGKEKTSEFFNAVDAYCATYKSWLCRDCIKLEPNEYYEMDRKTMLSLRF